jgi:1-phosphofructokinase family hexose kinase
MLLTVTSNPTIDRTLYVPHLTIGAVHRTTGVHLAAGGKGLNVTRAARSLGCEVLATGPLAGLAGQIVADLALAEGLRADWSWLSTGETRTCSLINHDAGDTTVINEQGPVVLAEDWTAFAGHVSQLARKVNAVAFSGSLPLGVNPTVLATLAGALAEAGQTVYVDTSGPALAAVLAQPRRLSIKVNQGELAAALGLEINDEPVERLIEASRQLLVAGAALVVVTLGNQGALAVAAEQAWYARIPPIQTISTVGSGDSLLAGLAVAQLKGKKLQAALAFGVACGSANAMSSLPGRFELSQVEALLQQVELIKLPL